LEIVGTYHPREKPWIDGDDRDSWVEITGIHATDSSVDLMDIPGIIEWAEQEAIKRIEGKK
jgi:hypothetical protein